MWNIAKEIASKEFSEEAFAVLGRFNNYLLELKPCPTMAIH
jgi:hypothetical protein